MAIILDCHSKSRNMPETLLTEKLSNEEKRSEINSEFNERFADSLEKCGLDVLEKFNHLKEKLKLNKENLNEFENNSLVLIQKSWLELAEKYGINGEGVEERNFRFHDLSHTIEFLEAQMQIFDAALAANLNYQSESGMSLTKKDQVDALRIIAAIGGSYHDIAQGIGPKINEDKSVEKLNEDVDSFYGPNFSPAGKELMKTGINATKIKDYSNLEQFSEPALIKGSLEHFFEGLYADSDLAAFLQFNSQHWRGNRLFWELRSPKNIGKLISYEEAIKWFDIQISVMEGHRDKYLLKQQLAQYPPYNLMYDENTTQEEANIELYVKIKEYIDKKKEEFDEGDLLSKELERLFTVNQQQAEEIKKELGFAIIKN